MSTHKTYIVEHLDPELGPWSELEYLTIARETHRAGGVFCLSSLPPDFKVPDRLAAEPAFEAETRGVEEMYPTAGGEGAGAGAKGEKGRVCLLDPQAEKDLSPEDRGEFDVFLFGGILGDDPPRDRTGELRKKGFAGRRLGPVQMTTDTAVRVTRMVVEEQFTLDTVPYLDFPELKFNEHESSQMPFRYVKSPDEQPVMPEGMVNLIKKDADKSIDDLF
ncbi:Uu.00g107060.m01.CDS01 [Anthostomella pinea]|uniref:Uu.00g107060.m01.CDS01 n=1 Tax=Anthostomella pinea TaxID=933095 RepID=A0AAI8YFY1_9PEZI|nr:Uu.00g107060.m01.CDS01 [Anthostomella pinea]